MLTLCFPFTPYRLQMKGRFANLPDLRTKSYHSQQTQHWHMWQGVCIYEGLLLRFVWGKILIKTCSRKVCLITPYPMTTPCAQQISGSAGIVSFFAVVGEVCYVEFTFKMVAWQLSPIHHCITIFLILQVSKEPDYDT